MSAGLAMPRSSLEAVLAMSYLNIEALDDQAPACKQLIHSRCNPPFGIQFLFANGWHIWTGSTAPEPPDASATSIMCSNVHTVGHDGKPAWSETKSNGSDFMIRLGNHDFLGSSAVQGPQTGTSEQQPINSKTNTVLAMTHLLLGKHRPAPD